MKNFHHKSEDMDKYELQGELSQFLWDDNADQLLTLLHHLYHREGADQFDQSLGKALAYACWTGAVKCVAALINAKPPVVVDLHSPCYKSFFPLHYAAQGGHPGVTELLLYHGARTDVRCNCNDITDHTIRFYRLIKRNESDHHRNLSLHVALNQFWCCQHIEEWGRNRCIAQLLIILSLPFMRNLLETVGLLAWTTEETKEEFLHFAGNGQVLEFAVLLVVARKKLFDSAVGDLTKSNALVGEDDKRVILGLLDIFDRAGDEIEAYVKKDKREVPILQVVSEATSLLHQAGCHLNSQEPGSLFRRIQYDKDSYERFYARDVRNLYTQKVVDIGMPHYSASGYRWALSKEPGHYKFKLPNISTKKILRETKIPSLVPASHDLKVSIASYHTSLENESDAKLKRFGLNSSNILSSKPFAAVIKRITRH